MNPNSDEWIDAISQMASRVGGEAKQEMTWHLRSLELCQTRELLGGIKATESTLYQTTTSALTAMAQLRGYLPK